MAVDFDKDKILEELVNRRFINNWKNYNDETENHDSLELFITPNCNLGCKYCYLFKHGDELYPNDGERSPATLIENLHVVMNYIIGNKLKFNTLELFSGEIWQTPLGAEILEIIYTYMIKHQFTTSIVIATNGSFLMDDGYTNIMQNMVDKFKTINVNLFFSFSLDGKCIEDDIRPFKDDAKYGLRNDEYYNRVFKFATKNGYGFHPMVSALSIGKWIDNYKWWVEMYNKYDLDITSLFMLEVRDNNWTPENIDKYLEFLDYIIDYLWENIYKHDAVSFLKYIFNIDNKYKNYVNIGFYDSHNKLSCALQKCLYVRLGDLALVPCHRTSYDQFIFGKLKVKDRKIVGIKANNVELAMHTYFSNLAITHQRCPSCSYKNYCTKGCLGAQYEESGEILLPCPTVCDLFKTRLQHLHDKYKDMGLFDIDFDDVPYGTVIVKEIKRIEAAINEGIS